MRTLPAPGRLAALAALVTLSTALACSAAPAPPPPPPPAAAPAPPAAAAAATLCAELPDTIVPQTWLLLPPVDERGRRPVRPDAVFARHLLERDAPPPHAGETLTGETGEPQSWELRQAEPDGSVSGEFAWGYASVASPAPRVMLAELSGAGTLFVNGEAAAGDSYGSGFGRTPVALRAGDNQLFVGGVREGFRLVLRQPEHALLMEAADITLPDLVAGAGSAGGGRDEGELAITLINASLTPLSRLTLSTGPVAAPAGGEPAASLFAEVAMPDDELPGLPPLGVIKLPLRFALREGVRVPAEPGSYELAVRFGGHPDEPPRAETLHLVARAPDAPRRVTRRSLIDDSVQEYAVRPPAASTPDTRSPPAVVLSLHGAGVDELNQAASYSSHPGWWIVAPSNRRPFGFDWQDWGRLDAYETLEHALSWTGADGTRVALTGHSMGGHGTWHLAVNDPDRFIAVGPSAGWSTFDKYPGRPAGALSALWHAADGAGETFELLANLVDTPVYVLHGSADDNVPASEGRELFDALLAAVGAARERGLPVVEPQLHVQPGAGHWWDGDAAPGTDCLDWPPFFALFDAAAAAGPSPGVGAAGGVTGALSTDSAFEWICADPWIDRRNQWISLLEPVEYGRPVRVSARWQAAGRHVELSTENAALLVLHWPDGQPPASCTLDGQTIECGLHPYSTNAGRDRGDLVERFGNEWRATSTDVQRALDPDWDPSRKTPARSGPFKRAFANRFVLVYGTAGDEVEDAELLARARYDSEVWRYRANGCAAVWSDRDVLAPQNLRRMAGRNLILYGNRDSNLAVQAFVPPECPLVAARGRIALGGQTWEGDDLLALCVYPRVGEETALLGWFADSGPKGSRLGYTLAPFVSGVGCPDFAIFDAAVLAQGDGGVRAAGWFDGHWRRP